jgi:hypothetical protein
MPRFAILFTSPCKKGGEYILQPTSINCNDIVGYEDVFVQKLGYLCRTKITMNDGRISFAVEQKDDMKVMEM